MLDLADMRALEIVDRLNSVPKYVVEHLGTEQIQLEKICATEYLTRTNLRFRVVKSRTVESL